MRESLASCIGALHPQNCQYQAQALLFCVAATETPCQNKCGAQHMTGKSPSNHREHPSVSPERAHTQHVHTHTACLLQAIPSTIPSSLLRLFHSAANATLAAAAYTPLNHTHMHLCCCWWGRQRLTSATVGGSVQAAPALCPALQRCHRARLLSSRLPRHHCWQGWRHAWGWG